MVAMNLPESFVELMRYARELGPSIRDRPRSVDRDRWLSPRGQSAPRRQPD